jgi:endonuclease YncB( thermonuclease family)
MRALLLTIIVCCLWASVAHGEGKTLVTLNGRAMPVFFNDGDSFRVESGTHAGMKARLAGYNTLESHGPVHRWGNASAKEMYVLAKMATLLGRRGVWSCTSDMKTDTYGRALLQCPELALAMVKTGLAHAMTVTAEPADPTLLAAQKEAIEEGRGIWSQGAPTWVLTSLHSVEERPEYPTAYNRVVSSIDGHSEKWRHTKRYKECDEVCLYDAEVPEASAAASRAELAAHEAVGAHFSGLSEADQNHVLRFWMMAQSVVALVPKELESAYALGLERLATDGVLQATQGPLESCMIYVDFKRRFGGDKAKCLK